ncbi:unnamed protein product [Phaeothamnion confervicola]
MSPRRLRSSWTRLRYAASACVGCVSTMAESLPGGHLRKPASGLASRKSSRRCTRRSTLARRSAVGASSAATRAFMAASNVEKRFWPEAFRCAIHVVNRRGTTALPSGMTSYGVFQGRAPLTADLRIFGSAAYVHLQEHQWPTGGKFTPRAAVGIMAGHYANGTG